MAEWLGRALQKLVQRFESARDLSTNKSLPPQEGNFCTMKVERVLYFLGILACAGLIASCFMGWAYYPNDPVMQETERTFTGFYTFKNYYGKPGKLLTIFASISLLLKLLPRVWAKRTDLFICAVVAAYATWAFFQYTGPYAGIIPQKLPGIFCMAASVLVMLFAAIFPDLRLVKDK